MITFSEINAQNSGRDTISFISADVVNYKSLFAEKFNYSFLNLENGFKPLQKINYYYYQSGLFCKIEYKIESKSKLAPRFRLGSLNYTEWMEGKGEFYSRYWK